MMPQQDAGGVGGPPPAILADSSESERYNAHWKPEELRRAVAMLDAGANFFDISVEMHLDYRRVENRLRNGRMPEVRALLHRLFGETAPPPRALGRQRERHPLDVAEERWAKAFKRLGVNFAGKIE